MPETPADATPSDETPSDATPSDETPALELPELDIPDLEKTVVAPPYRPSDPPKSWASDPPPVPGPTTAPAGPAAVDAGRVETALDDGDVTAARVALAQAMARHGQTPRLIELGQRLDELERVVQRPQLEARMSQARERLRTADYAGALSILDETVRLAPRDPEVVSLRERTERAAARHADALERERSIEAAAGEVQALVDAGSLDAARERLRTASATHGRHDRFDRLDDALQARRREAELAQARSHRQQARRRLEAEDWAGALAEAERALALDPEEPTALSLRERARSALDRIEGARVHATAVTEARDDVERLIAADELPRARARLKEAIDQLGEAPVLGELAARIDERAKDQRLRQRVEWAERRANEAEALIAEAGRRSRADDFAGAVERLERAQQLDPSHPEIEERLDTARAARTRRQEADAREADRVAITARVESLLDALELDHADGVLRQAVRMHGDDEVTAALAARLAELRRAEEQAVGPLDPATVARLDPSARAAVRERQEALAGAYSWKQAMLFPFRGRAAVLTLGLAGALVAVDLLGLAVPSAGMVLWSLLVVGAGLLVAPEIARFTAEGHNLLPAPRALLGVQGAALGAVAGLLAMLPLALLVVGRPWLGVPDAARPLGWVLVAVLLWQGTLLGSVALGAGAAFGARYSLSLPGHLKASAADAARLLLLVDLLALIVACVLVARLAVLPLIWWMGALPSNLATALLLVGAPHWIGVLVRRRRLRWADAYA